MNVRDRPKADRRDCPLPEKRCVGQSHCLSPVWATEEALCEKEPARSDQHKHCDAGGQYGRPAIPENPEYQGGRKRRNEACRRYCEDLQTNSL